MSGFCQGLDLLQTFTKGAYQPNQVASKMAGSRVEPKYHENWHEKYPTYSSTEFMTLAALEQLSWFQAAASFSVDSVIQHLNRRRVFVGRSFWWSYQRGTHEIEWLKNMWNKACGTWRWHICRSKYDITVVNILQSYYITWYHAIQGGSRLCGFADVDALKRWSGRMPRNDERFPSLSLMLWYGC